MELILLFFIPNLVCGTAQVSSLDDEYYYSYDEDYANDQDNTDLIQLLHVTHNECPEAAHECVPMNNCTAFLEERDRLKTLSPGTEEYNELFENAEKLVCNKEEKGVCCIFLGDR